MGKLEHMSTLELIATIEAKNHRFKIAGFIFAGCIAIGLVILLVLGLSTLNGVNTQLTQQKTLLNSQKLVLDKITASGKQRTAQIQDLQNHIDCITELFRQPNRQSLTIKDLNGCQFDSNGNIITPSGGSSDTQKTTNSAPVDNNGGAASPAPTRQPAPQSTTQSATPPQTPSQNSLIRTADGLFCPISLTSFACTR